jgi:hypothetical protein
MVRRDPCRPSRLPLQLSEQRIHIARFLARVEQPSIEIAVVADGRTERDVKIKPERFQVPGSSVQGSDSKF